MASNVTDRHRRARWRLMEKGRIVLTWRVIAGLLLSIGPAVLLAQSATDYVIGPQDVLSITVWDQQDLGSTFAVETDGTFTFPLIGRVKAGGLTLRELEAELIRRLRDGFFVNPQVTVAIEQYRSQRVFVMGEVRTPGPQALTGDMTLIEALARAGSTLSTAGDEAIIVRPPTGSTVTGPLVSAPSPPPVPSGPRVQGPQSQPATNGSESALAQARAMRAEVISVDIRDLQKGVLGQNVRLRDGDTIFVPRADVVYVFGQVRSPGAYPLQRGATVLQALSLAGGVTDRGTTSRVSIVRIVDGKQIETRARLDEVVRPEDTIIVMERFF